MSRFVPIAQELPAHLVPQAVRELSFSRGGRGLAPVLIRTHRAPHGGLHVGVYGPCGVVRSADVTDEALRSGSRHMWRTLAWVAGSGPKPSSKGAREWVGAW